MWKSLLNNRGLSLIELVVTLSILILLSSIVLPSVQVASKRTKELELKRSLREMRSAIDEYKRFYDKSKADQKGQQGLGGVETGYPKTLETLVEGADFGALTNGKRKFLRRIPKDPFYDGEGDAETGWKLRSHNDEPDTSIWGGEDVFDVQSASEGTAIDGTKYKDW